MGGGSSKPVKGEQNSAPSSQGGGTAGSEAAPKANQPAPLATLEPAKPAAGPAATSTPTPAPTPAVPAAGAGKDTKAAKKDDSKAVGPVYELFRYEGADILTYLDEKGVRIYEDDQGVWRAFPEEWENLGTFASADQPVLVTWVSPSGETYETFVDDSGQRMYCDFEAEAWLPFKKEWEGTGTFKDSSNNNRGEAEETQFGTFVHNGVTLTTYEAEETVMVTYYFDEAKGDWERLPDEWRTGAKARPVTASSKALVRANQSGALGSSGDLSGDAAATRVLIARKDAEIAELRGKVEQLVEKGNRNIEKAKKKIASIEEKAEADRIRLEAQIEQQKLESKSKGGADLEQVARLEKEIAQLRFSAADAVKQSLVEKDKQIKELMAKIAAQEVQLGAAKVQGQAAVKTIASKTKRIYAEAEAMKKLAAQLRADGKEQRALIGPAFLDLERALVSQLSGVYSDLVTVKAKYRAEMLQRKLLFNKIQELKGNIRVFCRSRGLSKKEIAEGATMCVEFPEPGEIVVTDEKGQKKHFEFDFVFGPTAGQADVFADTCPLITSVMDGYNVCIFAYGQTGAGKTYTMMGVPGNLGVNFRSLEELFKICKEREDEWVYTINVSFLEIYNESIRDLLVKKGEEQKLDIRQGPQGNFVPGLTEYPVKNAKDVEKVIEMGDKARSTSATAMNEVSSRSHSVLQIRIDGENRLSKSKSLGKLTLCDLAGSERVGRSEATGQRLIEAAAINKSLSSLGNVMAGLAAGQSHIPYRDSKLTYLLQDSLGGDSKTAFFVNCSPSITNCDETIQTLNFGKRLRNVSLGPVGKNVVAGGGDGPAVPPPPGKGKGKK